MDRRTLYQRLRSATRLLPLLPLIAITVVERVVSAVSAAPPVRFESDVRPLFTAKCVKCHGAERRENGLDLSRGETLLRGGDGGPVVEPGRLDDSPLWQVVRRGEMPPEGEPRLTDQERETLRLWIEQGAKLDDGRQSAPPTDQQIVPLLLLRCAPCHGGRRREAGLDLRTKAGVLQGGKSGPAAVPGKPAESLMVRRVHAEEMPPRRQLVSVSVKPMEAAELKKLEAWIAAGLPDSPPPVADAPPTPQSARQPAPNSADHHWAFRPPSLVAVPAWPLDDPRLGPVDNPIDRFLLAKLRDVDLDFAPEADRATLLRRLSYDLIGLPPTPEELAEFLADESPAAYEAQVERLLASPRHGERWARHWLDVAGYADSEGSQNEDRVRPDMWRYRDYVIRAFNADKPYDRFLHEQLAGDELSEYRVEAGVSQEVYDNLAATGFLRTAPDRTFANITNFVPDRLEVVADELQIFGSAVLGLTLHCARCHSHKFDPLPQRDYYRLAAVFKDALDEHDWLGPDQRRLPYVTVEERQAWLTLERRLADALATERKALEAAPDDGAKKPIQERIAALETQRRPEPKIRALWGRGDPSPTFVLQRGNYLTPGAPVEPGLPALLDDREPLEIAPPWPGAPSTGRRLALARRLTRPDHPLTARVFVNRVWRHHFGAGLVTTLANFGRTGAPPSHPELLDWLARQLPREAWSVKSLHRLLVTSRAYRQSSQQSDRTLAADPDNRRLSRMPLRRLEAEIVRDALLFVSGGMNLAPYGPPDDVDVRADGLVTAKSDSRGGRRSVYVLHRRTKLPTILESFDSPQMGPNCNDRGESIVAPQALHLLNNAAVRNWAEQFARRLQLEAGADPAERVRRAHRLAFGAPPSDDALHASLEALDRLAAEWRESERQAGRTIDAAANAEAERRALVNYCHALLNSAAFVYVD